MTLSSVSPHYSFRNIRVKSSVLLDATLAEITNVLLGTFPIVLPTKFLAV